MNNNLIKTEAQGKYLKISTNDIHNLILKELANQGLAYSAVSPSSDSRITRYRLTDIKIDDGLSQLTPEIYFRNSETPGTALMLYIGAYRFLAPRRNQMYGCWCAQRKDVIRTSEVYACRWRTDETIAGRNHRVTTNGEYYHDYR